MNCTGDKRFIEESTTLDISSSSMKKNLRRKGGNPKDFNTTQYESSRIINP